MAYIGVQGEDAAAYSSRNAVSLAFAAVFLTAANALGSSNATRASFIVRTCAMVEAGHHAAAARRARDGAWNLPRAAKQPKHAFSLQNLYSSKHGTIVEGVSSRCWVQSMCFRVVWPELSQAPRVVG